MPPPAFKPASVGIHKDVDADYRALEAAARSGSKPQQGIWKRLAAARIRLAQDALWGDVIPFEDIPDYFRTRYDVDNLYCLDLKGDVRCFYTVAAAGILFLDIVDHEEYDKWFPPKGRKRRR